MSLTANPDTLNTVQGANIGGWIAFHQNKICTKSLGDPSTVM